MKRDFALILVLLGGLAAPALAERHTVFPHFASGDNWSTVLFFSNQGLSATSVDVNFYTESGSPLLVESNIGNGSLLEFNLGAGAMQMIKITPSNQLVVGSVVVSCPSEASVRATEVFSYEQGGTVFAEVGVSQLYGAEHYSFPVEMNSSTGISTAVAFANPPFIGRSQVIVINLVRPDGSVQNTVTMQLGIGQHKSLYLNQAELFPGLNNFSGSASISSPEGLAVLALRQEKQAFGAIATDSGPILGPFVLTGTSTPEVEPNDSPAQAQVLSRTTLISGVIGTPYDYDAFQFTGKRGDIVSVVCDTEGLNSSLDSVLFIADASLTEIAWNDENGVYRQGDSFIQTVLPADGTYYIVVADYFGGGGSNYRYRLHVKLPS